MLGKVASNKKDELMEKVEIGDLSMRTDDILVYDHYQFSLIKGSDGSPEGRLTATGHLSDGSFFRVDLTIIGLEPEESKRNFSLSHREAYRMLEAITDMIITLNK